LKRATQERVKKTNLMYKRLAASAIASKRYMNAATNQGNVEAENYMMGNMNLIDEGQQEIQKTCVLTKRGNKEDAKRLAVSAIASRRGERGGITKYARGVPISPRSLRFSFLPAVLQQLPHLTDNSRDEHTL
jgi:hypothetical protein